MMSVFANTLMIASRMEAFERRGVAAPKSQRPGPWATRFRRWFTTGTR
jgi:hypothetical protein